MCLYDRNLAPSSFSRPSPAPNLRPVESLLGVCSCARCTPFPAPVHAQILSYYIQKQRSSKGLDTGYIGQKIHTTLVSELGFLAIYLFMPAVVIFLRNFHVTKAVLSWQVGSVCALEYNSPPPMVFSRSEPLNILNRLGHSPSIRVRARNPRLEIQIISTSTWHLW